MGSDDAALPQAILVSQLRAGPGWPLIDGRGGDRRRKVFFEFKLNLPNTQRYFPPFGPNSKSKFEICAILKTKSRPEYSQRTRAGARGRDFNFLGWAHPPPHVSNKSAHDHLQTAGAVGQ